MADIEIVYRIGHCAENCPDYDLDCHSNHADFTGCSRYISLNPYYDNGRLIIPVGDCSKAVFEYKRKGWTGKRYEMEEVHDDFDPGIDYMEVTIGNRIYNCVKVILDGKCIYNNYDDEEEKNED